MSKRNDFTQRRILGPLLSFAMLVALLIGDILCNTVIKDIVQRARPFHHVGIVFYECFYGTLSNRCTRRC